VLQRLLKCSSMQKNNIPILSTAILDPELLSKLEAAGVSCDIIPFIRISFIENTDQNLEISKLTSQKTIAVFTSKHAVEAIRNIPGTESAQWKIYCTGSSTSSLAANIFPNSLMAGTAENAVSLAKLIMEQEKESSINFFCSEIRRDELPSLLNQKASVREWILYKTLPTPEKIEREYQAVLFFSPSAVKSYFSVNDPSSSNKFFAIGNTTAGAIRPFCKNRIFVAKEASMESLVDKLIEEFQSLGTGGK